MRGCVMSESIDLTPTWEGIMPMLICVLQNPDAEPEGIRGVTSELMRLARMGDKLAEMKKQRDEARTMYCRASSDLFLAMQKGKQSRRYFSAEEVAQDRGWDCFPET